MSAKKLRKDMLSEAENSLLLTSRCHNVLIGHAFAVKWNYNGGELLLRPS